MEISKPILYQLRFEDVRTITTGLLTLIGVCMIFSNQQPCWCFMIHCPRISVPHVEKPKISSCTQVPTLLRKIGNTMCRCENNSYFMRSNSETKTYTVYIYTYFYNIRIKFGTGTKRKVSKSWWTTSFLVIILSLLMRLFKDIKVIPSNKLT